MLVPLHKAYDDLMDMLADDEDERIAALREKVLRVNLIKHAGPDFWEARAIQDARLSLDHWRQMPLRDQGWYIAAAKTDNMLEIYTRTYEEMNRKPKRT